MSPASLGLAPREGLELLMSKLGHTRPSLELRGGPQAGLDTPISRTPTETLTTEHPKVLEVGLLTGKNFIWSLVHAFAEIDRLDA